MNTNLFKRISSALTHFKGRLQKQIDYCTKGVWLDQRSDRKVRFVKVLNLSVRSFLSVDLQSKACAMTFRTLLAIVPALALLCAIGRGFGLQNVVMEQLIKQFPSQEEVLKTAFGFVDAYLSQASGGIFVGVGVVFLFWTLISLLRNIEAVFNDIWQVPAPRSIWRMVTDYMAIIVVLPILLICSNGISIFMITSLSTLLPFEFMKPAFETLIDFVGLVFNWLFFAGTYMLIPNTKVKFSNAIIPAILVGTACQVLQWLFLSGQLYVAKYNAIYGSFSFLPLFLLWMQFVWLFTLIGGVICYAMQNIGEYNYGENISTISDSYRTTTTIAVFAIIAQRFLKGKEAMTLRDISLKYKLPVNLITPEVERLKSIGLLNFVDSPGKELNERPVQPAVDVSDISVGQLVGQLRNLGSSGFIPGFDRKYKAVCEIMKHIEAQLLTAGASKRIADLRIDIDVD